jgi:hypothetical protein
MHTVAGQVVFARSILSMPKTAVITHNISPVIVRLIANLLDLSGWPQEVRRS